MKLLASLLAVFLAAPVHAEPASKPSTQDVPLPQLKQQEQDQYAKPLKGLPQLPAKKLSDLFDLHIENGDLVLKPKVGGTDRAIAQLDGLNGPATIMIGGEEGQRNKGPENATYVNFEHRDFSRPGEVFRSVQVLATSTGFQLAGDVSLAPDGGRNVQLILNYANKDDPVEAAARLYVQVLSPVNEDVITKLELTGNSFTDLRHRYPLETHTYVAPLLRHLHEESLLAPDPALTAQVFGGDAEAKADANLVVRVNAALAKFDAADFKQRQQAGKDLAAIGQPAATYLARADRTRWSVDKSNGVDAFLEEFKAVPQADVTELKRAPEFLIDCLYSDDATTRAKAAEQLRTLAPPNLKIDPADDRATLNDTIDRLYAALVKPAATQPATKP